MQQIILDGFSNEGFAGSPVVCRDLTHSNPLAYKVASVVVS